MGESVVDTLYINSAGLCIVWSFVPMLFFKSSLTQDNKFIDSKNQSRAVRLLGYVISGHEETPEYELALPKLMSGMAVSDALVATEPLTSEEKELANAMLTAILSHWTVLSNTSIEGLRESFIMRDGMLEENENAFYLNVEQRSIDMLLDQIPWSIHTISLPWMKKPIHITWR